MARADPVARTDNRRMARDLDNTARVRLDKWLWAARFFKTRPLAAEAIAGSKVQINGAGAKPGRAISVGDRLTIRRGRYLFVVIVRGLASRRGPASRTAELYEETKESQEDRARIAQQLQGQRELRTQQRGRPDKRDRRTLIRYLRRHR
ncbi:MAG: ribosome-associated heat shock protein Hsp15 [Gammaproteobacteria bacterium]|nr:MAG: ribosome-associated heat shock protein Hsp15 [Gammaproteobacteria bacterium]